MFLLLWSGADGARADTQLSRFRTIDEPLVSERVIEQGEYGTDGDREAVRRTDRRFGGGLHLPLENDAWNVPKNLLGGAEFRIQSRIGRYTVVAITYRYRENAGDLSMDDVNQDRVALEFFYRR